MPESLRAIFDQIDSMDEKSTEFLLKAINNNNLPGFDYLEFKQSLKGILAFQSDEGMAVKSAFATASTVGLTKKKLINSAQHYLNVLTNEKKHFEEAMNHQMNQRVHGREKEKQTLTNKKIDLQKKIEKLQSELSTLTERLNRYDDEVLQAQKRIEETSERFNNSVAILAGQIQVDIEKFDDIL